MSICRQTCRGSWAEAQEPSFKPGAVGTFDDSGVSIGSAVDTGQEIRIYYMGWNLGVGAPWRNSIGFMRADSVEGPFQRYSEGPIMDRSPEDPYTMSYPLVLQLGPGLWRMWYGSSLTWGESLDGKSHVIKQASSRDGIRWERDGRIAVGLFGEDEQFLVRPTVLPLSGGSLMMFASRGQQYTLGAALSRDGENWERCDARFGLKAGTDAWEDAAVCYPALFSHRGQDVACLQRQWIWPHGLRTGDVDRVDRTLTFGLEHHLRQPAPFTRLTPCRSSERRGAQSGRCRLAAR